MSEIKKSTSIMQYIAYAILAITIFSGVVAIISSNGNDSSAGTSQEESMF